MASFQETIGWEMMRTSENKNYRSDQFLPNTLQGVPKKNSIKIQKTKKHHFGTFSSQNRLAKGEKKRKEKLSFRSVSTRPRIENSIKNSKNIQKIK